MAKTHYFDFQGPFTVKEIKDFLNAQMDPAHDELANSINIFGIKNIEDAAEGHISFINNRKYEKFLPDASCSACLVRNDIEMVPSKNSILLKVEDPYYSYAKLLKLFFREKHSESQSAISEKAIIAENVSIGFNVIIEDEVEIGAGTKIDHGVILKRGVKIGKNCTISSRSYISYAEIGDNVIIHPGAVIGSDGFGFATHNGTHHKILHVGIVQIGDGVEIGAGSTIDRGSLKNTIIGDGTQIDNLVQIGHNVQIGRNSVIVSQVGIAGSTKLGDYVVVGGQAGIAGHLNIANFVQIAGKAGVISDIKEEKEIVGGFPSQPIRNWHKQTILLRKMLNDTK